MPIYEYYCQACGYKEEKTVKEEDRDKTVVCSACRAKMVRKVSTTREEHEKAV